MMGKYVYMLTYANECSDLFTEEKGNECPNFVNRSANINSPNIFFESVYLVFSLMHKVYFLFFPVVESFWKIDQKPTKVCKQIRPFHGTRVPPKGINFSALTPWQKVKTFSFRVF